MTEKEKLYETLGELLYAVAMADGVIQAEEKDALNTFLAGHDWESNVKWSFNYEESKVHNVEETYNKAISFCKSHGPAAEYEEFISAMTIIAAAAEGIVSEEKEIIESFSKDLIAQFQRDLDMK